MPDRVGERKSRIIVIGAGIGGLTAAALLAHKGYNVLTLDQRSLLEDVLLHSSVMALPLMSGQLRWQD